MNSHAKSARRGVSSSTRATPTSIAVSAACPKCGTSKKSGKRSCCARGGAWFKNCGDDAGDSDFDHTWSEGMQACKSGWCFALSMLMCEYFVMGVVVLLLVVHGVLTVPQ